MFSGSRKKAEPATAVPAPLPVEVAIANLERLQAERTQAVTALETGRAEAQRAEDALNAERERVAAEAEAGGGASRTRLMALREEAEATQARLTGLVRRVKGYDEQIEAATGEVRQQWVAMGHAELAAYEERFEAAALAFDAVIREGLAHGVVLPGWSPAILRLMRISIVSRERKHLIAPDRFKFRTDPAAMVHYNRLDAIRQRMSKALQGNDLGATLATGEADEGEAA